MASSARESFEKWLHTQKKVFQSIERSPIIQLVEDITGLAKQSFATPCDQRNCANASERESLDC